MFTLRRYVAVQSFPAGKTVKYYFDVVAQSQQEACDIIKSDHDGQTCTLFELHNEGVERKGPGRIENKAMG